MPLRNGPTGNQWNKHYGLLIISKLNRSNWPPLIRPEITILTRLESTVTCTNQQSICDKLYSVKLCHSTFVRKWPDVNGGEEILLIVRIRDRTVPKVCSCGVCKNRMLSSKCRFYRFPLARNRERRALLAVRSLHNTVDGRTWAPKSWSSYHFATG